MERARQIVGAKWAHDRKIFGAGVGVAILDTGICTHPDFLEGGSRIAAFYDTIGHKSAPYDDGGHGTHVAGIIGGCGRMSAGRFMGIAPLCHFISVKVLDQRGGGNIPEVLAGIDWVIQNKERYRIRILNISVGTPKGSRSEEDKKLLTAVDSAWDAGLVVVAAAGNNGPDSGSISIPGSSRKIITVGASDDNQIIRTPRGHTSCYSGRGPTGACILKPDIVAPGSNIISCKSLDLPSARRSGSMGYSAYYTVKSGTSMATPVVSGALALLLSKEPNLTNKDVKLRLHDRAVDIGLPRNQQGWGLLSIEQLLQS
ncbi:MAG: S8 family peptidase [Lachnospiraceae bacterium]|nr:S8 family peptidase [Lachnospiraceae bacterium]